MLNDKMKNIAKANNTKFPYDVMTLVYDSDERILATPLLQFYLKLGLKIEHIYYAIQYIEVSC